MKKQIEKKKTVSKKETDAEKMKKKTFPEPDFIRSFSGQKLYFLGMTSFESEKFGKQFVAHFGDNPHVKEREEMIDVYSGRIMTRLLKKVVNAYGDVKTKKTPLVFIRSEYIHKEIMVIENDTTGERFTEKAVAKMSFEF